MYTVLVSLPTIVWETKCESATLLNYIEL